MSHNSNTLSKKTNRAVFLNATWNFGSQVWNQLLYLVVTPVLLGAFGLNRFGLFALYPSVSALTVLFDFGLPTAMTRFLGALKGNAGPAGVSVFGMAASGGVFTIVVGAAAALAGNAVMADFVDWWRPDVGDLGVLTTLMRTGCLLFFFIHVSNFLSGVLKGMNRYDLTSKIWSAGVTLQAALMLSALGCGRGIQGVAIAHAAGAGLHSLALLCTVLKFIWPYRQSGLRLKAHLREIVRLIRFGFPLQISAVLAQVESNFGKYFLLHFAGLEYVSLLEIANRITSSVYFLMSKLYEVLLPESAALWSKGDKAGLAELHQKASKLLAFFAFLFYGAVFVGAPPFFELWLSGPKPELVWMLRILLIGQSMALANGVTYVFSVGIGKTTYPLVSTSMRVGSTLVVSFLFSSTAPVGALCAGSSLGALAGSFFAAWAYHRAAGASAKRYYAREILPAVFAAAIPCAVFTLIPGASGGFFQWLEPYRMRAFLNVAVICFAFMTSFVLIAVLTKYIKKSDFPNFGRLFRGGV